MSDLLDIADALLEQADISGDAMRLTAKMCRKLVNLLRATRAQAVADAELIEALGSAEDWTEVARWAGQVEGGEALQNIAMAVAARLTARKESHDRTAL